MTSTEDRTTPVRLEYDRDVRIVWATLESGISLSFLTTPYVPRINSLSHDEASAVQDAWAEKICRLWNEDMEKGNKE
jgi:hypothetical protein